MPTRYAQLPAGSDRNTPRLTDSALTQLAAGHPEPMNTRPYTSPIVDHTDRPRTRNRGGAR